MAYLTFETRTDVEFDYYLAEKLHRTVAEMRASVSNVEYIGWQVYYGRKAQRQEMAAKMAKHEGQ